MLRLGGDWTPVLPWRSRVSPQATRVQVDRLGTGEEVVKEHPIHWRQRMERRVDALTPGHTHAGLNQGYKESDID